MEKMKESLFELDLIQNSGLALEAIWSCVCAAHNDNNKNGVPFPLVFLILPLIFHQITAESLAGKKRRAILSRVLLDKPAITMGLQKRMEALANKTIQALSVGFSCNILSMQKTAIIPLLKKWEIAHTTNEVMQILDASRRLGWIFAELPPEQIIFMLGVHF